MTFGGAHVYDAYSGRMSNHDGDVQPNQILAYEFPTVSRVHGAIDPSLGQGKEHAIVNRVDEKLSNGLVFQASASCLP